MPKQRIQRIHFQSASAEAMVNLRLRRIKNLIVVKKELRS